MPINVVERTARCSSRRVDQDVAVATSSSPIMTYRPRVAKQNHRFKAFHRTTRQRFSGRGRSVIFWDSCPMVAAFTTVNREPGQDLSGAAISGVDLCGGRRHRTRTFVGRSLSAPTDRCLARFDIPFPNDLSRSPKSAFFPVAISKRLGLRS